MSTLVPRAEQMIHDALDFLVHKGCSIERLKMVVCADAPIAKYRMISTRFGMLRIDPDPFVRKGLAYVIEDPGRTGRGFAWVSR